MASNERKNGTPPLRMTCQWPPPAHRKAIDIARAESGEGGSSPQGPFARCLDRRLAGDVRDEEVHRDVLAVRHLVDVSADRLGHVVRVRM